MPPKPSTKPFRRSCTLWIHDEAFSSESVLFNSALLPDASPRHGRILRVIQQTQHNDSRTRLESHEVKHTTHLNQAAERHASPSESNAQPYVFVVRDREPTDQSRFRNLQISVSKDVADAHGFHNRISVWVEDTDDHQYSASHVELNFSDPLNRADLWKTTISELSRRKCVHQGQELLFLGSIKVIVKKLFVSGRRVPSALFSETSKPIFRSTAARFVFGIQVSREMFEFDDELSNSMHWCRAVDFMSSLLERWSTKKSNHMLSVMLFTRLVATGTANASDANVADLYRVVASDVPVIDGAKTVRDIRHSFRGFVDDIRRYDLDGETRYITATAADGNLLEAVNLGASACWLDDLDLDFVRTGTSIVILSPSPGMFNVDDNLLRITGERLMSRSIGVELVCLSAPPLNTIPLFVLKRNDRPKNLQHTLDPDATSYSKDVNLLKEASLSDENEASLSENLFVLPSWVETSFYRGPGHQGSLCHMRKSSESRRLSGKVKTGTHTDYAACRRKTVRLGMRQGPSWSLHQNVGASQSKQKLQLDAMDGDIFVKRNVKESSEASPLGERGPPKPVPKQRLSNSSSNQSLLRHKSSRSSSLSMTFSPHNVHSKSHFTALLGRSAIGKATATTSSSNELASPTPGRQASSENVATSRSLHSQFQVSLSRTSSATSASTPLGTPTSVHPATSPHSSTVKPKAEESITKNTSPDTSAMSETPQSLTRAEMAPSKSRLEAKSRLNSSTTPNKCLPWLVIRNPCITEREPLDAFGEWNHAFTAENRVHPVKWKALCSPASLPLTTEHFPSAAELDTAFAVNPYKVSLNIEDSTDQDIALRRGQLAREMVLYRISDGFQIAVGPKADKVIGASAANPSNFYADDFMSADGAAVMMLKGENIQLICASGDEVSVTRYQRKTGLLNSATHTAQIRTYLDSTYSARQLSFAATSDRNWSKIDNDIADAAADSYERQMAMPTITSHPRRARFVLIPVEPSSYVKASHPASDEIDEEIRLDGICKLTMMWQKNRWVPPEEERNYASWIGHKDINPLAIEYQTRDPSAVVAAGFESSILTEGESSVAMTQLFDDDEIYRTSHVDLQKLANDLQSERGIGVRSRRWRFRVYDYCFVGHDLAGFLLRKFQDIKTRGEAVEFGNVLMRKGLFQHVHKKHQFRDGNYFYTIATDYRVQQSETKSNRFSMRKAIASMPLTPSTEATKDAADAQTRVLRPKRPKVSLSGSIQYNVDPKRISTRPEIITIHYDKLHNPDNAFHFLLEWTNATARLVEDALTSWANAVTKFGLKLVQIPIAEICAVSQINPLRSPYPIEMALKGPPLPSLPVTESPAMNPQQMNSSKFYQKELLKRFDFVLDHEAASSFPVDVDVAWSWGQLEYHHDQYIHRSGILVAQIVDDWKFVLLANRLYNNRVSSFRDSAEVNRSKGTSIPRQTSAAALSTMTVTTASPIMSPLLQYQSQVGSATSNSKEAGSSKSSALTAEALKDDLETFCNDIEALRAFYEDVRHWLLEKPTPALSALSVAATPSLQAIPNLDLPQEGDEDAGDLTTL